MAENTLTVEIDSFVSLDAPPSTRFEDYTDEEVERELAEYEILEKMLTPQEKIDIGYGPDLRKMTAEQFVEQYRSKSGIL